MFTVLYIFFFSFSVFFAGFYIIFCNNRKHAHVIRKSFLIS